MAGAAGRAATDRRTGAKATTSGIGPKAGLMTSTTWSCSATTTIATCTRADGRWSSRTDACSLFRLRHDSDAGRAARTRIYRHTRHEQRVHPRRAGRLQAERQPADLDFRAAQRVVDGPGG